MLGNQNARKDFKLLENIISQNKQTQIISDKVGDVVIESGETGKKGYGLKHIIEQRFKKDNLTEDEITALIHLILESVRSGDITRENGRNLELSKNGIVAILRKEPNDKGFQWILTGFANTDTDKIKKEATDTINAVIANNSYTPEFSSFRKQVGAVIASLDKGNTNTENVNINDEIGKSIFDESLHPRGKGLYLNTKKLQNLINQQRTNLADVEYLDLESIEDLLKKNSGVKDLFLTSEMNVEIRKSRFINRLNYEFCKLVEEKEGKNTACTEKVRADYKSASHGKPPCVTRATYVQNNTLSKDVNKENSNYEEKRKKFLEALNYEFCKLVEREKRREAYREAYLDKLGRGYIAYLKKYYPELV